MSSFIQQYGHLSLNELVSDWQEKYIDTKETEWLNTPPSDFLEFVRNYPHTPFDWLSRENGFIKDATFAICQVHRIWQTASLTFREIQALGAKKIVDLGSFPFSISLMLRDYFKYDGDLTVTANIEISDSGAKFLSSKNIEVELLDLDPFVSDPDLVEPRLPTRLAANDGSADLILSSHVIEHLYHPRTMLTECARLLRPQGRLVITTDNAMMIDTFINYISGYGYTFEPVKDTAAMHFDNWRGHVRFFTAQDIIEMASTSGFKSANCEFSHCFYNILFDEYFLDPGIKMSGWKRKLMTESPWLRNELVVIAEK